MLPGGGARRRRLRLVRVCPETAFRGHRAIEGIIITSHHGAGFSAIDTTEFRRALGHFATGVTVVSYTPQDADEYRGTTVNSFTSVSLDPPLVLVSLGRHDQGLRGAAARDAVRGEHPAPRPARPRHVVRRPAATGDAGRAGRCGPTCRTSPRRAAHFRCVVRDVHDAGDHVLVVGQVEEFQATGTSRCCSSAAPLSDCRARRRPPDDEATHDYFGDFPELW